MEFPLSPLKNIKETPFFHLRACRYVLCAVPPIAQTCFIIFPYKSKAPGLCRSAFSVCNLFLPALNGYNALHITGLFIHKIRFQVQ